MTIDDIPPLASAMGRFAAEHSGFESTAVNSIVLKEMGSAADINRAALVPIRHKTFGFEAAVMWGFFLSHAAPHIISEHDESLSFPFDLARYNAELVKIYDIAAVTNVWEYCEDEDEDEDDSDEDGDDSDSDE